MPAYVSHNIKKDEFIYNICDYILQNNLVNDKDCMGFLYGHICHVVMDDVMHPLIRKVDSLCVKNKHNHSLIEGYIDSYLAKYKYKETIDKYSNEPLFNGKINKKISNLIDYVYDMTYNCRHVSRYYRFNLFLYKKIKYLYKVFGINLLKKFSGFNKFLDNNKKVDVFNNDNKIFYNNYLGYRENNSIIDLYNESVILANLYIENVNKYLGID